jgi:putative membrane-bound dehydrogenase-like protein
MNHRLPLILLLAFSLYCGSALAVEPTVTSNDLPRFPAVEATNALKTFRVKPGFHLELAACEPNIASPVALSFDENGRIFVVEMIDYSERHDETPHLGRIRCLEDINGDGTYDRTTVYADNLPWPTAVFCYGGGIFVAASPDILYLKDTNGDGKADQREVVFTGFAEGVKRVNVQAMLNSFIWGLDNRIHGATSGNGGLIKSMKHPDTKPLDLHGRDFVIEPRNMTMTSEAGGGQHGLSFDDFGRRFACNNSDHIRLFMYDDRYASRNPAYAMPAPLASIAVDGPAAEVYRVSPEEPWRVIRTRWRVSGLVPGPIEGGGRSSGYFTGATGTTVYRGNAFPPEYLNNAFVGDAGGNLVHRKVLIPDGPGLKAERGPGEEMSEFVASTDTWFRPVQFANAPDGTLYIIDMYRETIEHPWSLPDNIKKFLDLNSGNNRGRIYRVVPNGYKRPAPPRLGKAGTADLVATLENPNGWHRDTAARLLYERQDKSAVPELLKLVRQSKNPLARIHALHSLEGLGALKEDQVVEGLGDPNPIVRQHAVLLSEKFIVNGVPSGRIGSKLVTLGSDPSINVRYQLAFTLGEITNPERIGALAAIAKRDLTNSWMQAAVLSSLRHGAGELMVSLGADENLVSTEPGKDFLRRLVTLIAAGGRPEEIGPVVTRIGSMPNQEFTFSLMVALGEGLEQAGSSLRTAGGRTGSILDDSARVAFDSKSPDPARVQAVRLLGFTSYAASGERLITLLDSQQSQPLQLAVLGSLRRFPDPQIAPALIERWEKFTPRLRSDALAVLLARPNRARALLEAIDAGKIRASALTTAQQKFLRTHSDKNVRELALKAFGAVKPSTRQQAIDSLMPGLGLNGDPAHGKKIYEERCISCHRVGNEGFALGPDLITVKNTGKEKLLVNIVDPNREVRPEYVSYVIETKDDQSLIGLITSETTTSVTLRQAYGKEDVVNRSDIVRMQSQGQSLMPEGLEAGLTSQDAADLLDYIETAEPPPK